jgi:hypothetical protein
MINRLTRRSAEITAALLIAVAAFVMYRLTLCPTLDFIDSGELATVACTLGIAHPTGYPLFSIIGWLFVHIPLGMRPITQLNLMAAVLCSVGLFIFFRFCVRLLNDYFPAEKSTAGNTAITTKYFQLVLLPAAAGTLILAFSETYWSQALSIEVYSLHCIFLSLLLLTFIRAISAEDTGGNSGGGHGRPGGKWILFAFVLGLAFTNHMTTILLAPAFITWYFGVYGFGKDSFRRIGMMILPFVAGFAIQFYLPIRASMHPVVNWGNPVDFDRWLTHFSGKVYRVWIFSSTESASKQFRYFCSTIGGEFGWIPLLAAVAGIFHLMRTRRRLMLVTALLFFGCLLYSINYDIHDIDSYFLLIYYTVAVWIVVGVRWILSSFRKKEALWIAAAAVLVAAAGLAAWTKPGVDESSNVIVEKYTRDLLSTVEPNGIVISYQWDYFVSAATYLQVVEGVRPDVVIIDKELCRRSWYFEQLKRRYPGLLDPSAGELSLFLAELKKFEHDLPYDPTVIEGRYAALLQSIIRNGIGSRPVYVTQEIEPRYTTGYTRVPCGIPFRLYADTLIHQFPYRTFGVEVPVRHDIYRDGIVGQYVQAYVNNGIYAGYAGKREEAMKYADEALKLDPGSRQGMILRSQMGGR